MTSELFSLTGRVALVTGSSRGLGQSLAEALAKSGAHVVLNGRDEAALAAVEKSLSESGLSVSTCPFDVTDEATSIEAVAAIAEEHGRLDILVNNAGLARRGALEEYPTEDWRYVMDVNLNSCFYLAREAAKPMLKAGYGRIIGIASIASFIARPSIAPYIASKHGLAGLTKALAVEFGERGVTANAIAPGYFATELTKHLAADPEFDSWLKGRTPMRRWGKPEELGGAVVYLASPAAGFVTGQNICVNGGLTVA